TLSVGTAPQSHFGEDAFLDLALLAQEHLVLEGIDLVTPLRRDPVLEFFAPAGFAHGRLTPCSVLALSGCGLRSVRHPSFFLDTIRSRGKRRHRGRYCARFKIRSRARKHRCNAIFRASVIAVPGGVPTSGRGWWHCLRNAGRAMPLVHGRHAERRG